MLFMASIRIKTGAILYPFHRSFGGEGPGAEPDIYALIFKNVFGAKLKLVSGYRGTKDLFLALERQEIDGLCGISWGTLVSLYPTWLSEKKINIIRAGGTADDPGAWLHAFGFEPRPPVLSSSRY